MDDRSNAALADEESFEAIEQAVMETARGRWFLAEFASRNRQADTASLLKSITRLERVIARSDPLDDRPAFRSKLTRLIDDLDILVATLAGDGAKPDEAEQKLTDCVMLGEKVSIDIAVLADASRDLIGKFAKLPESDVLLPELDRHLSELVRLASDQMSSMRRFEALAEVHRHLRIRLKDLINTTGSVLTHADMSIETPIGAPANDQFPSI